jgi:hypothetical protein
MADEPSYLKAALLAPANLIGLSAAGVGAVATGDPTAAVVAAGLEVFYLAATWFSPAFRRRVRAQARALAQELPDAEVTALLEELAPSQREHYFALKELRDKLLANYRKLPGGGVLVASSEARVGALLTNFLRLLTTLNGYRKYLNAADRAAIAQEISGLERELSTEGNERLREVKHKRVEILRKRLLRFTQAEESREIVSHQLAGIEDLLRLTHEQSIAIRDPESVTRQLDALAAEAEATLETVRELEKFMDFAEEFPTVSSPTGRGKVRS